MWLYIGATLVGVLFGLVVGFCLAMWSVRLFLLSTVETGFIGKAVDEALSKASEERRD